MSIRFGLCYMCLKKVGGLHVNVKKFISNVLEGFKTLQRRRGDILLTTSKCKVRI